MGEKIERSKQYFVSPSTTVFDDAWQAAVDERKDPPSFPDLDQKLFEDVAQRVAKIAKRQYLVVDPYNTVLGGGEGRY